MPELWIISNYAYFPTIEDYYDYLPMNRYSYIRLDAIYYSDSWKHSNMNAYFMQY